MGIKIKPRYLEEIKIPIIKYCRILKYPVPLQRELKILASGGQVNKKLYKTLRNEENYFYYFRLHQYLPCLCTEL